MAAFNVNAIETNIHISMCIYCEYVYIYIYIYMYKHAYRLLSCEKSMAFADMAAFNVDTMSIFDFLTQCTYSLVVEITLACHWH